MTPDDFVVVLEELERRRRRDFDQAREWLLGVRKGHEGSISLGAVATSHDGDMGPLLLDFDDVADALQVSPATVKRLVRDGLLPAVKVARTTRVRRTDLAAYVDHLAPETRSLPPRTQGA